MDLAVAEPGRSTEKVLLWRSKEQLLAVFVAFSLGPAGLLSGLDPVPVSLSFHWIVSARAERMATQQSAYRHHTSSHGAISINGLDGILGTRGIESARSWKKRRDDLLIKPKKCD